MRTKTIHTVILLAILIAAAYTIPSTNANDSGIQSKFALNTSLQNIPSSLYIANVVPLHSTSIGHYNGKMNVMVGLKLQDVNGLDSFLKNVSNPGSSMYGKYISQSTFISRYSPPTQEYEKALSYFRGFPGINVSGFTDRLAISIVGNASTVETAFHTQMKSYISEGSQFYSATSPSLPAWLESHLVFINGLENYSRPSVNLGGSAASTDSTGGISYSNGYPIPIGSGLGSQLVWGSDMQKAYNVTGIINSTSLNHTAIATILWSDNVAPFYPQDVYSYFNRTLPSWEAKPRVVAVPLDGAPLPGISAQNDTGSASFENTLDIEMAGSLSPGATIYNVYTPGSAYSYLDQSLGHILNPGNSSSGLNNVSVISNSWYSSDMRDPLWTEYTDEATARGITVLACSGDSGDNISSSKALGSNAAFPGTDANSTSGVLSVGGTDVTLYTSGNQNNFLSIQSNSAWYSQPNTEGNNGLIGTQGGISTIYQEPEWQIKSTANSILKGQGRGVPDVSAVANRMLMFISINGTSYYDNPQYYYAWGTSVATPVTAGILADINAYLVAHGHARAGFINPLLYNLSNIQYSYRGMHPSDFPQYRNAFNDVVNGSNSAYSTLKGYDLVTGLGSINAGNLAHDLLANVTYEYNASLITSPLTNLFDVNIYWIFGGVAAVIIVAAVVVALLSSNKRKK